MMFTLLSQLAIGTFFLLILVHSLLVSKDPGMAVKVIQPGIYAVGPIMALSLLLSLFHLGSPFTAYLSILNFRTAWLSREILTAGGFFFLTLVYTYTYRKGNPVSSLGWIAGGTGLAAIYSMASIYSNSIFPAWTNVNTYITFFGTTFMLGSIGTAGSIAFSVKGTPLTAEIAQVLKKLSYISIFASLFPLLYLPVFISALTTADQAAIASAKLLGSSYVFPLVIRWALPLVGLGMLFYSIKRQTKSAQALSMSLIYSAAALVVTGEFIGRYIFYATAVATKLG
jgi:anaerobic dimethyl sulfoxide reductase subunit C (anchor subunit)